jgi:hypothetical protein
VQFHAVCSVESTLDDNKRHGEVVTCVAGKTANLHVHQRLPTTLQRTLLMLNIDDSDIYVMKGMTDIFLFFFFFKKKKKENG